MKEEVKDLIDYWEFAPKGDLALIKVIPPESEKKTESGIIIKVNTSVVEDRPRMGVVIAKGDDFPHDLGCVVFITKNAGYDLKNIRKHKEDDEFLVIHPDAVLGIKVKDNGAKQYVQ